MCAQSLTSNVTLVPKANQRSVWLNTPGGAALPKSSTTRRTRLHQSDMPARRPATLLWIDDYQPFLEIYKIIFEGYGYTVLTASSGKAGLEVANNNRVDAVVVDYEMPDMNGGDVARELKNRNPQIPVVLCSGSLQLPRAIKDLVDAVCDKAGSRDHLLSAIQGVIGNRQNFRSATPVYAALSAAE